MELAWLFGGMFAGMVMMLAAVYWSDIKPLEESRDGYQRAAAEWKRQSDKWRGLYIDALNVKPLDDETSWKDEVQWKIDELLRKAETQGGEQ